MFSLSDKPTYWFKVEVRRPDDATGKWQSFDFRAEFKRRLRPDLEAMVKKGLPSDAELMESELVGWADVRQPDGSLLEVNATNRTALLAEPFVQPAIVAAWVESALRGPAKN